MPATRSIKRSATELCRSRKAKRSKIKIFNISRLPIELRQRIYFFALAQETTIDNEVLRAYLSLGRFKPNPLLPALANVNEAIRIEPFQPFTQANTIELGSLDKSTVQRWRNFVRHYDLDWNIARNVHSAAIDLRRERTLRQWRDRLSTNYVTIGNFNFIRDLAIYPPVGHPGHVDWVRQMFYNFVHFDLPKLSQLTKVYITDVFLRDEYTMRHTGKWWLQEAIGEVMDPDGTREEEIQIEVAD